MKCKKMFLGVVFGLAVLMGILVLVLPQDRLEYLVYVSRFFEAMLPVLAVGALIKYLACSSQSCCSKNESCGTKEQNCCN